MFLAALVLFCAPQFVPKVSTQWVASPPTGYKHADLVKFVGEDEYVFVSWDNIDGQATDNLAALYAVNGNGSPVWTQSLTGTISHNDRVWDAKDGPEFYYQRSANGPLEISRWDTLGRIWASTAYGTPYTYECGGMSADGGRIVLRTTGEVTRVLDGADDSTTFSVDNGMYSENAALSRDGSRWLACSYSSYVLYDLDNDVAEYSGTTRTYFDQITDREDLVALSADGNEFIVLDERTTEKKAYIHTWNGSGFTKTDLTFDDFPRAVAISKDGSVAVVLTTNIFNPWTDSDLTAWVIDVAAGAIATDGQGAPIKYSPSSALGTPNGVVQHVSISDDNLEFCFATYKNHGKAVAWTCRTDMLHSVNVYRPPSFWRTRDADFTIKTKKYMVIASFADASPQLGTVMLKQLP